MNAFDLLGVAGATEVHPRPHEIVYRDRLQQGGIPDGGKLRDRHGSAGAGLEFAGDIHQAVGVVVGQRPQQHAVHYGENGGVGADAERQGKDRNQGERRVLQKRADGKSTILAHAS